MFPGNPFEKSRLGGTGPSQNFLSVHLGRHSGAEERPNSLSPLYKPEPRAINPIRTVRTHRLALSARLPYAFEHDKNVIKSL